jgi:hypothetical protein
MNLHTKETYINRDRDAIFGESEILETEFARIDELFLSLQREFGRCLSKAYIDDGDQIGWVFSSRQQYTDSNDTYIREVWVTVHNEPPTIITEYHRYNFGNTK